MWKSPKARRAGLVVAVLVAGGLLAAPSAADPLQPVPAQRVASGDGDDPGLAAATQAEIAHERAQARLRNEPAAVQARQDSRTAYHGLGRDGALSLTKRVFVADSAPPAGRLLPGEHVAKYLSDNSAVVSEPDGRSVLLESSVPLLAGSGGTKTPVNLALVSSADGYTTANSNAPVTIDRDGSVNLPDAAVAMKLRGASRAGSGMLLSDSNVFVGDAIAGDDVDLLDQPTMQGVDVSLVLRSASSPTSYTLDLTLPSGASLRTAQDPIRRAPGAEVVRDGQVIAAVRAPLAQDADGQSVPVTMSVEGDTLRLAVDHRGRDLHYPLLVDPEIVEDYNFGAGSDNGLWTNQYSSTYGCFNFAFAASFWGTGLYTTNCANSSSGVWLYNGDWGEWRWQAPRATAIARVEEMNLYHTSSQLTCLRGYIWDRVAGVTSAYEIRCSDLTNGYFNLYDSNPAAHRGNFAVHNTMSSADGLRYAQDYSFMGWAKIYVDDYDRPTASASDTLADGKWHAENTNGTSTVSGHDDGLGVKSLTVNLGGAFFNGSTNGCSGYRASCPQDWSQSYGYNTNSLSEGPNNNFSGVATDVVGQTPVSLPQWTVKVDKSPPSALTPSKDLYDNAGNWVQAGTYPIQIDASDALSGIRTEQFLVNGTVSKSWDYGLSPPPPDGYSMEQSWSYTFGPEGVVTFGVGASDAVGHPFSPQPSWQVGADTSAPTVTNPRHSISLANWMDSSASVTTTVDASDTGGAGPKKAVFTIPGTSPVTVTRACAGNIADPCGLTWSPQGTYGLATVPEGDNTLKANVSDGAGLNSADTSASSWHVKIDRSAPVIGTPTGTLYAARNQTTDHRDEGLYGASYDLQVGATDGNSGSAATQRSGVHDIDIQVLNGQSQVVQDSPDPNPQSCATNSCTESRSWTFNSDSVPDGDYTVKIVATDQLGHASSSSFGVTVSRQGTIYHGTSYDGDPTQAGTSSDEQDWAVPSSVTSRTEDTDSIGTRDIISCSSGGCSCSGSSTCDEVRTVTRWQERSSADSDGYSVQTSSRSNDPYLPQPSTVLAVANAVANDSPISTGPIDSVLSPWQMPPPAHGTTYEQHRVSGTFEKQPDDNSGADGELNNNATEDTVTNDVYVDSQTKFPLKMTITDQTTGDVVTLYWTYDKLRTTRAQHSSNFFALTPPDSNHTDYTETEQDTGNSTQGPMTDQQTAKTFTPYYLGPTPVIGTTNFCFATSGSFRDQEGASSIPAAVPANGDSPYDLSRFTLSYSEYTIPSGACVIGTPWADEETPNIEVVSMALTSGQANDLRDQFQTEATNIENNASDPDHLTACVVSAKFGTKKVTAYVLPTDVGESSMLVDISTTTTVRIQGPFTKTDVQSVLNQVIAR